MSSTASSPTAGTTPAKGLILKSPLWVAPLCWIAVLLDGFDAVVLGAVMPALLEDKGFDMTIINSELALMGTAISKEMPGLREAIGEQL